MISFTPRLGISLDRLGVEALAAGLLLGWHPVAPFCGLKYGGFPT